MKRFGFSLLLTALLTSPLVAQSAPQPPAERPPTAPLDRASYAIGLTIGKQLKSDGLGFANVQMLVRGIADALTGKKPALSETQITAARKDFQKLFAEAQQRIAKKRLDDEAAFLAQNAKMPGVTQLASGLQYKVLKKGTGPSPKATDTVKTHYHGTFINGEVFDSSVEKNEPATFAVNGVIRGWTEALQLMKVGGKWQLYVPSKLAYGPEGRPGIPPSTPLIFEVELLDIVK